MQNKVFREKSIEKITSPEQLNDYVKVANVRVWVVLASLVCLLAAVCFWGVFGRVEAGFPAAACCENGKLSCYIRESDMCAEIAAGAKARIDGMEYTFTAVAEKPEQVKAVMDDYTRHVSGAGEDDWVYCAEANADLQDGTYSAFVIAKSVSPISFVIN